MKTKRIFSLVLALTMALALFPVTALAAENGQEDAGATPLTEAMFTVDVTKELYTGSPVTKTITGRDGDRALVEGTDYTVEYKNNLYLGWADITITGMGDYSGTLSYEFKIGLPDDLAEDFFVLRDGTLANYWGTESDVVIPEGVVRIREYAFPDGVTSVFLPSTVQEVDRNAFNYRLSSIQVDESNPYLSSLDGVLFNKDKTQLIRFPQGKAGPYTIPNGVTHIRDYAFMFCYGIVAVTFSDSVDFVGDYAFIDSGIFYVDFGDGLSRIQKEAFASCRNLTSVVLPKGSTQINEYAFIACQQLKSVVIPQDVDTQWGIFQQCEALTDVYYVGSQEDWDNMLFGLSVPLEQVTIHYNYGAQASKTLTKDMFTVDTSDVVYTGSPVTKTIIGQDGDRSLVEGTDYTVSYTENTHVGGVNITITGMGDYTGMLSYAFTICLDEAVRNHFLLSANGELIRYLGTQTEVKIPEGITRIASNVFNNQITSVTIPYTVTAISSFSLNTGYLKDVYYPGSQEEWEAIVNVSELSEHITIHYNYGAQERTPLTKSMFTVDTAEATHTGSPITKAISGKDGEKALVLDTDYTVAYADNVEVGTAKITITGKGGYTGTLEYTFTIRAKTTGGESGSGSGSGGGTGGSSGGGSGGSGGGSGGSGGGSTEPTTPTEPVTPVETETPSASASETFRDVEKGSWYEPGVTYAVERGLFNGVAEGVFAPQANMTRAMLMTVLARLDGQETSGGITWYAKGMAWAMAQGISDGTMPESNITREQLVTMLYRYAKATGTDGDLHAFTDGDSVSPWARDAMVWAVSRGILKGKDGARLDPQGTATRAEVATILQRFVEKTMSK